MKFPEGEGWCVNAAPTQGEVQGVHPLLPPQALPRPPRPHTHFFDPDLDPGAMNTHGLLYDSANDVSPAAAEHCHPGRWLRSPGAIAPSCKGWRQGGRDLEYGLGGILAVLDAGSGHGSLKPSHQIDALAPSHRHDDTSRT